MKNGSAIESSQMNESNVKKINIGLNAHLVGN
jgi:hypothetical protein